MKAKSFILFGLFFLTCSGNVFLSKDGTEGDIKEKQWAIQMEPDNPLNYIALGNIYLESMRYDEAIAQFNKALELSPGLNPGLLQKGIALWRKQDKKAALNAFKSVLYSPKQENLHIQIAHELGCPFQVDRISHGNGEYAFPAPSPVRDELLCQSTRDGNWELYLLDFTGQVIKRVTDNYARDESPVFAPDGKTFAFTSTRDDSLHTSFEKICRNIYLGNIESGSVTPLVSDPSDDWSPVFSPDGEK
ncbi:PD40 domain-containing protein, partial [candidate division KSB1 bacterium]|nr:PD40 domain-containing protein [candidate division KSB1 bacterium]